MFPKESGGLLASRRWHLVHLMRWTTMGILLATTAAILLATFGFLYIDNRRDISEVRQELTNQTKALMRDHVDRAVDLIEFSRKELGWPKAEIQAYAKKRLEQISYANGQGYIFVDSYEGRLLINPNSPHLVGQDLWEMEDINGIKIAQTLIAAAKNGSGFVTYSWVHPITKRHEEKVTYARGIDDWQWAVCSGLYLTDVNEAVAARQSKLRNDLYKHAEIILGIAALSLGLFVVVSLRISRRVGKELNQLESNIIAGSTTFVDLKPETYRILEFAVIATGANKAFATVARVTEELHKEQQVVQKSEAKFRGLVESSYDWIWELDAEGVIKYASPQVEAILGYKPEEVIGKTGFDLMPEEEADRIEEFYKKTLKEGKPLIAMQNINLHKDGHQVVLESSGVPVIDENGKVTGYRGIDRDITKRKRAEEELRNLRNYLSNIINSMPSVIIGVDPDGVVTQWNNEAERATGVSVKDAVSQPLDHVFPRLAPEMDQIREAMQSQETLSAPKQSYQEGSETHYEDITVYPLIANGVEGAVIRIDDVTDRVRIEEMMVQSEKMVSVGGLAAGMAHEINNPLAGMMQTADVMKRRLTEDLPANYRAAEMAGTTMDAVRVFMEAREVPEMLERISESGNRAAEIVQNMINFAHRSNSTFSTQDLAELLDHTVDLAGSDYDLSKKYDFRQIEIIREYEENLPHVPCESGKIQQVLFNILRNGAEAMQSDREKTDKPRFTLRLTYDHDAGRVRIEIEDNGPGMDEATRKRVFEPFFTTKPTDRGTGLGLSVSYFIITENHYGEMAVESTPGLGTKFIIHLPVERKQL